MKKILILLMLVSGYAFARMDSTSVRISAQDSIPAYTANDIFVMQKKIGSSYKWKKMYMSQLMGIMHDSVGAIIPRLTGTPTSHILLKTFPDNLLYRGDFNFNWKRIDSLTTVFNSADFKMSDDTLKLKNSALGVDTSKDYTWTGNNKYESQTSFIGGLSLGSALGSNAGIKYYTTTNSYWTLLIPIAPTANVFLFLPSLSANDTLVNRGWARSNLSILPSQTGNSGKFLKTNGTTTSWGVAGIDSTKNYTWTGSHGFTQTTNFYNGLWIAKTGGGASVLLIPTTLTNARTFYFPDETDTLAGKTWVRSHAAILPSQSGHGGQFLKTSGSVLSWATAGIDSSRNYTWTGNHIFGGSSTTVQFLNPPYFGALGSLNGLFYLMSSGSYYTQINAITPTANRTISLPNASGTVALTNQVPTLVGDNTWVGGQSFNGATSVVGLTPFQVGINSDNVKGQINFANGSFMSAYAGSLLPSSLTADRIWSLPDNTGTIALTGANTWVGTQTLNNTLVFNAVVNNTGGTTESVLYKNVLNISGLSAPITITLTDMVDGQIMWISNNDPSWAATVAGVSIAHGKSALCRYVSSSTSWKVILSN